MFTTCFERSCGAIVPGLALAPPEKNLIILPAAAWEKGKSLEKAVAGWWQVLVLVLVSVSAVSFVRLCICVKHYYYQLPTPRPCRALQLLLVEFAAWRCSVACLLSYALGHMNSPALMATVWFKVECDCLFFSCKQYHQWIKCEFEQSTGRSDRPL